MSEYVAIADSDLEVGDRAKSAHVLAFNNNVLAINEMDQTAIDAGLFVPGAWYIEDGAGGSDPVYDSAVDGTVSSIETPDLEDGFDYRFVFDELQGDLVGGGVDLEIDLRIDGTTYVQAYVSSSDASSDGLAGPNYASVGEIIADYPLRSGRVKRFGVHYSAIIINTNTLAAFDIDGGKTISRTADFYYDRIRLTRTGGGVFNGGKMWLLKSKRQVF